MTASRRSLKKVAPKEPLANVTEKADGFARRLAGELALPLRELGAGKIRAAVVGELLARGYEATKSFVRVPLTRQLEARLRLGGHVRASALHGVLLGATKPAAKAAASELVLSGHAKWAMRGGDLTLVGAQESVLEPAECVQRARELEAMAKLLKKTAAGKNPIGVLRTDLVGDLSELVRQLSPSAMDGSVNPPSSRDQIVQLVRELRDPSSKLAWVPDVVRRLGSTNGRDLLLRAARERTIELRPEGGLGRLSAAEQALCPSGAGGTPLSWVRILEDQHG